MPVSAREFRDYDPARDRRRGAVSRREPAGAVVGTLLYSSRAFADVIYREELDRLAANDPGLTVAYTLTRDQPEGWTGFERRIDEDMLAEVFGGADPEATAFVCGPTRFVEVAAEGLVGLGYDPSRVRTERFGPSGR